MNKERNYLIATSRLSHLVILISILCAVRYLFQFDNVHQGTADDIVMIKGEP